MHAYVLGEVSSGARDVEIRTLRERIKELQQKEKSVNNGDRVHVMPKVCSRSRVLFLFSTFPKFTSAVW